MAVGIEPWTVLLSGTTLGEHGFIRAEAISLSDCIASVLARLRTRPGDWDWLTNLDTMPSAKSKGSWLGWLLGRRVARTRRTGDGAVQCRQGRVLSCSGRMYRA